MGSPNHRSVWIAYGLVVVALVSCRGGDGPSRSDPAADARLVPLFESMRDRRYLEARLVGTAWAPAADVPRGSPAFGLPPALLIASAAIEKNIAGTTTGPDRAALGVAYLVTGRTDEATLLLETTVRQDPSSTRPEWWIALSAARYTRAQASGDPLDLAIAADAASRVLPRRQHLREALFNRALAATALGLRTLAERDLRALIPLEADEGWRTEARRQLDALVTSQTGHDPRPTAAQHPRDSLDRLLESVMPAWEVAVAKGDRAEARRQHELATQIAQELEDAGDAFARRLVPAHAALPHARDSRWSRYAQARRLSAEGRPADARIALREILRGEDADTPLALAARISDAFASLDDADRSAAQTAMLAAAARVAPGDHLLRGDLENLAGRLAAADNDVLRAVAHYRRAADRYDRVHDLESAATVRAGLCYYLHVLGEHAEEWRHRSRALAALERVSHPVSRYLIAASAALGAQRERLSALASDLQDLSLQYATQLPQPLYRIEALGNRANIRADLGDGFQSARDARAALASLDAGNDTAPMRLLKANLSLHLPLAGSAEEAAASASRLTAAIEHYRTIHRLDLLAMAYHRRGRAFAAAGNIERARADFLDGAAAFREGSRAMRDSLQRARYFDSASDLLDSIVGDAASGAGIRMVLHLADEIRGGVSAPVATPRPAVDPSRLAGAIPPGQALLYYVTLPKRLLILAIKRDGITVVPVPVDRTWLRWLVSQSARELRGGSATPSLAANVQLHELLIRPVARALEGTQTLVVSVDSVLAGVSFPTLFDERRRRYLVEDRDIGVNETLASIFETTSGTAGNNTVAVVGAPRRAALGEGLVLPELPEVSAETRAIAGLYPGAILMLGDAATKPSVTDTFARAGVVHFAGHAVYNESLADRSGLVLQATDAGADLLSVTDVSALDLRRVRLVVLSACRSGRVPEGLSSRGIGLASAFRRAGAREVIGSQWEVPDRGSRILFTRFHEHYAASRDAVAAMGAAQRRLLASADATLTPAAVWGAFQVFGATFSRSDE